MLVVVAAIVFVLALLLWWKNKHKLQDHELLSLFLGDKHWSDNEELNQSVHRFQINISDDDIKYLHHRLDITRFAIPSLPSTKFNYGVRDDYLKEFLTYWRTKYDWRKQEKMMNEFNHFKTNVEGLNVHFIHERPEQLPRNAELKVLLLMHGWPGSFVEYLEVIKRFTNPVKYGANESEAFAVVCPSIPGFGFSDAPQKKGFHYYECARVFHKLMLRLGYKKYYAVGSDWGTAISIAMGSLYPSYVQGCYTTIGMANFLSSNFFQAIFSYCFPQLFYSSEERQRIFPIKKYIFDYLQESGYFHLQGTKPDTVGFALSDSPAGLAAYILEKFSTWTDRNGRNSNTGLLEKYWTNDQLLNNIMIYWWCGNISSSMRIYKETFSDENLRKVNNLKVHVPSGFGWFPDEFFTTTKFWLKSRFSKLVHFTRSPIGGHFPAFQCPYEYSDDVRLFVRKVEEYENNIASAEKKELETIRNSHLDRYEMKQD